MTEEQLPKVKARVIIEMLGSPKEHIQETLKKYVKKLHDEPTIEILEEEYAEPAETEGKLWTTFVEIDAWFKDPNHLIAFCFDAMPSSVEVLEPEELKLPVKEFEGLINDLQARLHTLDLSIKQLKATTKVIDKNAVTLFRNFILYALKEKDRTVEEMSQLIGMSSDRLKPFIDKLIEEEKISKDGEKYSIQ